MNCKVSLRDRKKAATRAALGAAAARLARQLGLECVTSEAIAAEAGVSTRTFHNYFSSKEEAVLREIDLSVQRMVQALRERPIDEPIWDSLEHLAIELLSAPDSELDDLVAVARLVEESPALHGDPAADARRRSPGCSGKRSPSAPVPTSTATCTRTCCRWSSGRRHEDGRWNSPISGETGGRGPAELASEAFAMVRAGHAAARTPAALNHTIHQS